MKRTPDSNLGHTKPHYHDSILPLCPTIFDSTNQFQRIKHSPLKIPLIKLGFLLQIHPQYLWKCIRTEGVLPTSSSKRLERRFPKRKAPLFLIQTTELISGNTRRPLRVLLQLSHN